MSGFRIARDIRPDATPKAKAVKSKDFLSFIHDCPSVISGQSPVQAAHLSAADPYYLHYGRGKSSKAGDRWILPITFQEHLASHDYPGGELAFWAAHGINPHELSTIIWGAFCERGTDALPWVIAKINAGLRTES
jgi:hypothetical protein